MNKRYNIHSSLIKINNVRNKHELELKELELMRKSITDNQRKKLETRIGIRKQMIQDLNEIELNIREEL